MYTTKRLWLECDRDAYTTWAKLLEVSDLSPDEQIDYTVGIYDGDRLIATGSLFLNIIKCVAVAKDYQNKNLLTEIIKALFGKLEEDGIFHSFLYTKAQSTPFFKYLGFSEIARTNHLVLMEQGLPDFADYLANLKKAKRSSNHAAGIVMKADPFTKGHLHLVETAAKESDVIYLFVISEENTEFPAADRIKLVKEGTAHLPNVVVLPTNSYIVSQATFPSYFLKNRVKEYIARVQAELDATVFKENIAPLLSIQTRYVGEEPFSRVTEIYNEGMQDVFAKSIKLHIIPRVTVSGNFISASRVRQAFKENDFDTIKEMVPETTYTYLLNKAQHKVLLPV